MLWLCIALPQFPLEALQANSLSAAAVTACKRNVRVLVCCNRAARQAGLKAGMSYTLALTINEGFTALERRPDAERAALDRLAGWACQFSSRVVTQAISPDVHEARAAAVWVEVGASLRLFGKLSILIDKLECGLKKLRYTYRLGIAPTPEGAALLARSGVRRAITSLAALRRRIQDLPIERLRLDSDITQHLCTVGVRTVGALLALPPASVAKRFGPEMTGFLDRLMGRAPDPRPAYRPPEKYAARFLSEIDIGGTEALLFPLRRMLHEFSGFLRARDASVQHFTLELHHRGLPPTLLRIGLSMPDRSAGRFFALAREKLGSTTLPAATSELTLLAEDFSLTGAMQPDLLDGALRQREQFSYAIDRIAARLGAGHVHSLQTRADHRPEAGWRPAAFDEQPSKLQFPARPVWLVSEPATLLLDTVPSIANGPERIESGWWDGTDLQRDYYVIRTGTGAGLWVFRDLKCSERSWHLHGLWS